MLTSEELDLKDTNVYTYKQAKRYIWWKWGIRAINIL